MKHQFIKKIDICQLKSKKIRNNINELIFFYNE